MSPRQEELILNELPKVRYIAKGIHSKVPSMVELDDLIQAGSVGLMSAAQRFDESKNLKFSTFAQHRIRGAILDSLRRLDWGPRWLRPRARQVEEAEAQLNTDLGRAATETELADVLSMSIQELQQIRAEVDRHKTDQLTTAYYQQEDADGDYCEVLPDTKQEDQYTQCLRSERLDRVAKAFTSLSAKQQEVVNLYYFDEFSFKEISKKFGYTESGVCKLHKAAIRTLRSHVL
jgi:RNA polymerase sigma factor for flagellar operon FliA